MSRVFIGGSRGVSRLSPEIAKRLDNVVASGHDVLVGDANGADKAVQKYLRDAHYSKVTVFCSSPIPRNNLGSWPVESVQPKSSVRGFQFHAVKDREMARSADFGLMIWDGKSPGTLLNVLRLVRGGKVSVLFSVPDKAAYNIKSIEQWDDLLSRLSVDFRRALEERATPTEWAGEAWEARPNLFSASNHLTRQTHAAEPRLQKIISDLNLALASADAAMVMDALTRACRDTDEKMTKELRFAINDGRARGDINHKDLEFAFQVLSLIGLRLEVKSTTEDVKSAKAAKQTRK